MRRILAGLADLIGPGTEADAHALADAEVVIDDRFVGDGYGVPTPQSREAIELLARTEALFLDPTYTAKAMAGLLGRAARRRVSSSRHGALLAHRRTGGAVLMKNAEVKTTLIAVSCLAWKRSRHSASERSE